MLLKLTELRSAITQLLTEVGYRPEDTSEVEDVAFQWGCRYVDDQAVEGEFYSFSISKSFAYVTVTTFDDCGYVGKTFTLPMGVATIPLELAKEILAWVATTPGHRHMREFLKPQPTESENDEPRETAVRDYQRGHWTGVVEEGVGVTSEDDSGRN